ncbi:hypothetical protein EVAR_90076_1 [Eumeta japonica]|uniref:Uncharacterized protein n=1 Tax=Eumeta variegata TaxID=151549 RepID=A0A4C1X283_EUMVA|nr:hypothetical protein EVAR_90076_1 [Eumeta japonica]
MVKRRFATLMDHYNLGDILLTSLKLYLKDSYRRPGPLQRHSRLTVITRSEVHGIARGAEAIRRLLGRAHTGSTGSELFTRTGADADGRGGLRRARRPLLCDCRGRRALRPASALCKLQRSAAAARAALRSDADFTLRNVQMFSVINSNKSFSE